VLETGAWSNPGSFFVPKRQRDEDRGRRNATLVDSSAPQLEIRRANCLRWLAAIATQPSVGS
jgi:hypothetical protein